MIADLGCYYGSTISKNENTVFDADFVAADGRKTYDVSNRFV